jgi:hypothetical protein
MVSSYSKKKGPQIMAGRQEKPRSQGGAGMCSCALTANQNRLVRWRDGMTVLKKRAKPTPFIQYSPTLSDQSINQKEKYQNDKCTH